MRIVVTQPYLPEYRKPLFAEVNRLARRDGHQFVVVTGSPDSNQSRRGDTSSATWQKDVHYRTFSVIGRRVALRRKRDLPPADVIVTELDPGNLLAWSLALQRKLPWIAWGHGASYTSKPVVGSNRARSFLAERADFVMTYTERGRAHLLDGGVNPTHVEAIGNSTDTEALINAVHAMPFQTGIQKFPHALFVGAVDKTKRIDFLLSAARLAHQLDNNFTLTIVGRGDLEHVVRSAAAENDWIKWVPKARDGALAVLARHAAAIWMPGRVGLVAVDAIALGIPVHTTRYRFHAPEIDFLTEGESIAFLTDDPHAFASESLAQMQVLGRFQAPIVPSIGRVAERFYRAVVRAGR